MHLTDIVLWDGTTIKGPIQEQRYDSDVFERSYIKLFGEHSYTIAEMHSATTKGERVGPGKISDVDEIAAMRELWDLYKEGRIKGLPLMTEER
jgi:hypothetical protein